MNTIHENNRGNDMDSKDALVVFNGAKIRRIWHNDQWYFSVIDVAGALTESSVPKRYWSDLKSKLLDEGFEPYDKIVRLTLQAEDGKMRLTDCVNTESMFRIIQSIPSKKAEPFKRWLAKVGYDFGTTIKYLLIHLASFFYVEYQYSIISFKYFIKDSEIAESQPINVIFTAELFVTCWKRSAFKGFNLIKSPLFI